MSGVIIVTGGFGVLGRAVVAELMQRGLSVAAIDLAPVPEDHGATDAVGHVDLVDATATASAYAAIADRLGPISGLVNVAGGFLWEPVDGGSPVNWDRMYAMNLKSAAISCAAVIPLLAGAGSAIVNIGAAGAISPVTGMAPYAASKAGVKALGESLADELRGRGIRVNTIQPTIIDTPTNRRDMPDADVSTWVAPSDAAKVVAFLLSADAAAITGASILLSH